MSRATVPDRRRAFLVRTRPLPVFRVRSASGEAAHLVVLQPDGGLVCNCTAAGFGAACSHQRIVRRSIERRTGMSMAGPFVLGGGRRDDIDAAWEVAG